MRNYDLLKDIYLGDIDNIEQKNGKSEITLSECIFAVECYNISPDKLNFDIAKIMFDGYLEKNNSKEDIQDLANATKNISVNAERLFERMSENEYIAKIIQDNSFETTEFLDETLRLDSIILRDKSKINTLIEVEGFKKVLKDIIPLEKVDEIIDVAKQSADIIIGKNQRISGPQKYAPLAVFLAEDIVETLVSNWAEKNTINTNLWDNVTRYDLSTIKDANLEEMSDFQGPQYLREQVNGPIYEASWVLTENSGLKFASTYYDYGNHRSTSHTDLANGDSIISGGMAYFSEDKKTLLAIDNKTGHYQTSLQSVFKTLPIFEASDINIDNTIISDFGWDEPKTFKTLKKTDEEISDRVSKIRAKSFPNLSSDSKNKINPK